MTGNNIHDLIMNSALFDEEYYLKTYPDVEKAGINPVEHFIAHGASELRNPSEWFHTRFYLQKNPNVAAAGLNPIVHYLQDGARKGLRPHPFFDGAYYQRRYSDVNTSGVNPLSHYLRVGMSEGRLTVEELDPLWYLKQLPVEEEVTYDSLINCLVVMTEDISEFPESSLEALIKVRLVIGYESLLDRIKLSYKAAHVLPVSAGREGIIHAIRYALFNKQDSEKRIALAAEERKILSSRCTF
jgi:hypothetical protein